jgi:hypothetical protein
MSTGQDALKDLRASMAQAELREILARRIMNVKPDDFFVVSIDRSRGNNEMTFWRKNRSGYTTDLLEAGIYPRKDAESLRLRGKDVPVSCREIIDMCRAQFVVSVSHFDRIAGDQKDVSP